MSSDALPFFFRPTLPPLFDELDDSCKEQFIMTLLANEKPRGQREDVQIQFVASLASAVQNEGATLYERKRNGMQNFVGVDDFTDGP